MVGRSKPFFDIWGDAVNVASRLESTGIPDRVHVSQEVVDMLNPLRFRIECRGPIVLKGIVDVLYFFCSFRRLVDSLVTED